MPEEATLGQTTYWYLRTRALKKWLAENYTTQRTPCCRGSSPRLITILPLKKIACNGAYTRLSVAKMRPRACFSLDMPPAFARVLGPNVYLKLKPIFSGKRYGAWYLHSKQYRASQPADSPVHGFGSAVILDRRCRGRLVAMNACARLLRDARSPITAGQA